MTINKKSMPKTDLKVKNWGKFQHFKDRRPPWIKLYRDILDDMDWHSLSGEDAKMLVMLWLIASENEGGLPDAKTIAFRFRVGVSKVEQALERLGHWLTSERYQDDINESQNNSVADGSSSVADIETPLRDREETETEKETDKRRSATFDKPNDVSDSVWTDFLAHRKVKKSPVTETVIDKFRREASKAGVSLEEAMRVCCARGWQGFDASWLGAPNGGRGNPAYGNGVAL